MADLNDVQNQLNRLMIIQELIVTSLDNTNRQAQDLSAVTQMSQDDLRRLREKFLENGIMAKVAILSEDLSDIKKELSEIREVSQQIQEHQQLNHTLILSRLDRQDEKISGTYMKLFLTIVGLMSATIGGIVGLFMKILGMKFGGTP